MPGDVSVTGYDGILPGEDLLGLTTLRTPVEAVAAAAVETMQRSLSYVAGSDSAGTVRQPFVGTLAPESTAAAV